MTCRAKLLTRLLVLGLLMLSAPQSTEQKIRRRQHLHTVEKASAEEIGGGTIARFSTQRSIEAKELQEPSCWSTYWKTVFAG